MSATAAHWAATAGAVFSAKSLVAAEDSFFRAVASDCPTAWVAGACRTGEEVPLLGSMDWNYVTSNWGCGIIAGGAPELPSRGMGWGGGDRYLLGLKPPMAAMSAMFVIWIMVFCCPKLLLMYWFGEKCCEKDPLAPAAPPYSTEFEPAPWELWL